MNDREINAAARQLINHPENLETIMTEIAHDVLTDESINYPFAVFKSRLRRIESVLVAEGVSRELVNSVFGESVAIFHREASNVSNPTPTKRYANDNFVPRLNGARK